MITEEKKTPFKEYTVLCNSTILDDLFCVADIYRIFVLSLTADKATGLTDTTLPQLATLIDESVSNYTGKDAFTDKLRKCKDIQVETRYISDSLEVTPKKRNCYKFRIPIHIKQELEENFDAFRMIHRSFFFINDLPIKIKGYLIKLYSVTNTNTLYMGKTKAELEKLLHMTHTTITKYNKTLEAKGYIKIERKGVFITCQGIKPILKRSERTDLILLAYKQNLELAISNYNKTYSKQLKIENISINDIHKLKLDKTTAIYAQYHITGFKTVENINGLAFYLETGFSSKIKRYEQVLELEEILVI